MKIKIQPNGTIRYIYTEELDLSKHGDICIERISHVEPSKDKWYIHMSHLSIGPFNTRSEAIKEEIKYIEQTGLL